MNVSVSRINSMGFCPRFQPEWFERFIDKIAVAESGCWEWQASLTLVGYGQLKVSDKSNPQLAHRLSYQLFNGDIGEKLLVCHTCDNRKCVNPQHLFLGNHKTNADDMVNKNRHAATVVASKQRSFAETRFGELLLVEKLSREGLSTRAIAQIVGWSKSTVARYLRGFR